MIKRLFRGDSRMALLKKNVIFSFLVKGWSGVVVLLMVPLTLKCLGAYTNGLWLTISSILVWIDQMDIGLGNGLRNTLATHIARGDERKARETVASTLAMLVLIILPVMFCLLLAVNTVDCYAFLNASPQKVSNLVEVISVSVMMLCGTFVLKFIGNFYMGMQLPAVSNLLTTLGQTLAFLGTLALYVTGKGTFLGIAIVNTAAPLLTYLLAYPYTFYKKYPQYRPSLTCVNLKEAKLLMNTGVQFFILQIACVVLFLSTNLIISKLFTPEMVTPYQVTFRYFQMVQFVFVILFTPFWTATTDAWESNDVKWLETSSRKLDKILLLLVTATVLMMFTSHVFYHFWVGDEVVVTWQMDLMMAIYTIVTISSNRYSYILNGIGVLKPQIVCTVIAAALYIPLCMLATELTSSIIALMAVMWIVQVPGLIVNYWQYRLAFRNKKR